MKIKQCDVWSRYTASGSCKENTVLLNDVQLYQHKVHQGSGGELKLLVLGNISFQSASILFSDKTLAVGQSANSHDPESEGTLTIHVSKKLRTSNSKNTWFLLLLLLLQTKNQALS